MKTLIQSIALSLTFILFAGGLSLTIAQTQRNPVLEECTGTWCQWCPCGHDVMELVHDAMPNAILIGYHGPPGSSDPWDEFAGNVIISSLSFSGYPTAVIDRTGPPLSRDSWLNTMNLRNDVPATVNITLDKNYNQATRDLDATVNVTALEDLTGEYKMTMILLEDGLVYPQTGNGSCPGSNDYVHNHVVRSMINGALGEELNGANPWNTSETISKDVNYTVPAEFVADSCELVVLVYEVSSPLYNGEIQQAEKWTLVSPDFAATIASTSPDVIADNVTIAQFSTVLYNEGLFDDTYYINPATDGPAGWTGEYTTVNGTFSFGDIDSVEVAVGESTTIDVSVNPNGINGYGQTYVEFTSKNDPGLIGSALLRNVTTTGVNILVVDASEAGFGSLVSNSLDAVYTGSYGEVSRTALQAAGVDLSNFHMISWSAGEALPVFIQEEVDALQSYLDGTGNLFINGQDIGSDIFEATGQSQFAQSFYNDYLHATYEADMGSSLLLRGIAGDPITDDIQFVVGDVYDRSPDEISPFDSDATSILTFLTGPTVSSIRAETSDNRIVYLGIGFEQIDDEETRDSIMARSTRWLTENVVVGGIEESSSVPYSFALDQNYPNPFNPSTKIGFAIPEAGGVKLTIYNLLGQEVKELVNRELNTGYHEVEFNASGLASGVYVYRITSGNYSDVKMMTLLK